MTRKTKHLIVLVFISIVVMTSANAQDVEQLSQAAPVSWSGGLTWSNIFTWPPDADVLV